MTERATSKGRLKRFFQAVRNLFGADTFLCDTCRYDWGGACTRGDRPNARTCPDYVKR